MGVLLWLLVGVLAYAVVLQLTYAYCHGTHWGNNRDDGAMLSVVAAVFWPFALPVLLVGYVLRDVTRFVESWSKHVHKGD